MLTQIANETFFDFDLYRQILEARHERGLFTNARPNHHALLKLWQEAMLDAQLNIDLNNIESAEKAMSKIVNYKK